MSGAPSHGDPTPVVPGQAGDAAAAPFRDRAEAQARGDGAAGGGPEPEEDLGEQVRAALAGLDEAELATHPEAFEALGAAIVAELRSLEEL